MVIPMPNAVLEELVLFHSFRDQSQVFGILYVKVIEVQISQTCHRKLHRVFRHVNSVFGNLRAFQQIDAFQEFFDCIVGQL